ncbi:MAG: cyclic nucleotide-binding domain-containing protein [Terriglobales bacterium]
MSSEFARSRLSQELEQALRPIMTPVVFPKGATLYEHGTEAAGIYLVESGSVRVLIPAPENQKQLLEVVHAGAILGLSESMAGDHYRVTAEAEEPTTAAFITRQGFCDFLDNHHEFCMQIVRLLSDNLHGLYHRFRSVSAHPGRPRRRLLNEQLN